MTDVRLKISPPWITYVNKVNALFQHDPQIKIEYSNEECMLKIFVEDGQKAAAIEYLLPYEVEFGNTILTIEVIPANGGQYELADYSRVDQIFNIAFAGNPVFAFTRAITGIFSNILVYVVFKNRVVQFFNDNLNDIYGNISTLYQEIASDVLDDRLPGVCYCTDIEEKVGKPLGEWP